MRYIYKLFLYINNMINNMININNNIYINIIININHIVSSGV